jgi:hypothetical protein
MFKFQLAFTSIKSFPAVLPPFLPIFADGGQVQLGRFASSAFSEKERLTRGSLQGAVHQRPKWRAAMRRWTRTLARWWVACCLTVSTMER